MANNDSKRIPPLAQADIDRFWSKVDKAPGFGPNGDCWKWNAAAREHGYGRFFVHRHGARISISSHRMSFFLSTGEDPMGFFVIHSCDFPPCNNPDHLRKGTHADNMADRTTRNRQAKGDRQGSRLHPESVKRGDLSWPSLHPETMARGDRHGTKTHPESILRGEKNGSSKLTWADIRAIRSYRAQGVTQIELANRYGVSKSTIKRILRHKVWLPKFDPNNSQ